MEPICETLLSLPDDGSVLMHFIRSGFKTPNPKWFDLSGEWNTYIADPTSLNPLYSSEFLYIPGSSGFFWKILSDDQIILEDLWKTGTGGPLCPLDQWKWCKNILQSLIKFPLKINTKLVLPLKQGQLLQYAQWGRSLRARWMLTALKNTSIVWRPDPITPIC